MAGVYIPLAHQADHDARWQKFGLSSYTTLIDLQPDVLRSEASQAFTGSQCVTCSFASFLRNYTTSGQSTTLRALDYLLSNTVRFDAALRQGQRETVEQLAVQMGARGTYEVLDGDLFGPRLGLPAIAVVDAEGQAGVRQLDGVEWLLVCPEGKGAESLLTTLHEFEGSDVRGVLLGYYEHAAGLEQWVDFLESLDDPDAWQSVLSKIGLLGFSRVGLMIAYPPCVSLQWPQNRFLESLRARLDLQFRRLDGTASLMCPENVSGYALYNDTTELLGGTLIQRESFALRYRNLILVLP